MERATTQSPSVGASGHSGHGQCFHLTGPAAGARPGAEGCPALAPSQSLSEGAAPKAQVDSTLEPFRGTDSARVLEVWGHGLEVAPLQ